jgi:hypothetical protein
MLNIICILFTIKTYKEKQPSEQALEKVLKEIDRLKQRLGTYENLQLVSELNKKLDELKSENSLLK